MAQDYEDSGEFTFRGKLICSIRKNLIIYGTGLAIIIVLIIYLAVSKSLGLLDIEDTLAGIGNFLYKKIDLFNIKWYSISYFIIGIWICCCSSKICEGESRGGGS